MRVQDNGYKCKQCLAPATVDPDGTIHRTCEHTGLVILDLRVECFGQGHLNETPSPLSIVIDKMRAIGTAFLKLAATKKGEAT